jgi:hypothetical protein
MTASICPKRAPSIPTEAGVALGSVAAKHCAKMTGIKQIASAPLLIKRTHDAVIE